MTSHIQPPEQQPDQSDTAAPYSTYTDLQRELGWHREQLHVANTALTAIGAIVDQWRGHGDQHQGGDGA